MLKSVQLFIILTLTLISLALASEIDGKWKATVESRGRTMEYVFDFKTDGDVLTGTVTSSGGETVIQNGHTSNNQITFETVQNGNTITNKGTLSGETFFIYYGPWEMELICERDTNQDQAANKTAGSGIDGAWLGSIPGMDGGDMELTFKFKVQDNELSGTVESMMGEIPLSNTKVNGNEFSFDIDVQGMIISHNCKLVGENIIMKYNGMNGDEEMTLKRQEAK